MDGLRDGEAGKGAGCTGHRDEQIWFSGESPMVQTAERLAVVEVVQKLHSDTLKMHYEAFGQKHEQAEKRLRELEQHRVQITAYATIAATVGSLVAGSLVKLVLG